MSPVSCPQNSIAQWFALYVKLRYERVVSECLLRKGFEAFSPSYAAQKEGRNKMHQVETPFFPGYVFARFNPQVRMPILTTPGVREVVGYGKIPVPIPDEEMSNVRETVNSKLNVEPCLHLATGSRVRIVRGPLAGVEGILDETRSSCRVIVSVSLIQRSIRVEVDREMLANEVQWEQANVGHFKQCLSFASYRNL